MRAPRWLGRRIAAAGPHLTLCLSEDEYRAAMKQLRAAPAVPWPAEAALAAMQALENREGDLVCIVCLRQPEGREPVDVAASLVHEAVHCWQMYAEHIGEDEPGQEQEAYAIQSIAQELMTEFARRMGVTT